MVTTDPQGVAWSVELRSSGRVCANVRRGRTASYGVLFLLLCVPPGWVLLAGDTTGRIVAVVLLGVFVPACLWAAKVLLRVGVWRAPHVVVDAHGVWVRRHDLHVPWWHLSGAAGYPANHNRQVTLVVTEECYDAWLSSRSWLLRLLGRRGRKPFGMINLPANLDVDSVAFGAWLTHEAHDRIRSGGAPFVS